MPGKSSPGVIQYYFGRTVTVGRFVCDSILNAPPQILPSAVSTVRARHNIGNRQMDTILSQDKCTSLGPRYAHQDVENNLPFLSDYDHVRVDETCIHCDKSMQVLHPFRESIKPIIHYGTIASGYQIMRHGQTRESCREALDILCFEMEAAGLMHGFPCLVIRGICDYADSHKDKSWQEYAAISTAASAKELLGIVVAHGLGDTQVSGIFWSSESCLQARDLFESYVKQMISYLEITKSQCAPQIKRRIKQYYGPKAQRPVVDDILDDIFFPLSESFSSATYVVDDLDECEPVEIHKVSRAFRKVSQAGIHRVFISGREILSVSNSVKDSVELPISSSDSLSDIRRFIDWRIDEKMAERPLTEKTEILEEVKRCLNEKADRM
ncbi:uncharacterized protein A1O9_09881 [Exophiala aquamarina CBS 119918]|uniref:Nucleoside phosphorylase domain-containing protein n=1 Tax=Exophiala aquamarina CBS 119918 TaxID=1182545 RepID=A0A072P2K2_9EURO|nr:uncharacterized protein A1O9_09881 [Exophiala aquamarina CBS 119918]KEF54086.1 hypothetical protein A1O9_09881 [Exophiala aquamarina CBS 119918]